MMPESVVQKQVEAYNRHDLGAFSATYADDVAIYRFPSMKLVLQGRAALERHYGDNRFNLPQLRAEILDRICHGDTVIDYERVFGLVQGETVEAVAIYEVQKGLISRVWFIDDKRLST